MYYIWTRSYLCTIFFSIALPTYSSERDGPSFSCTEVKSMEENAICKSPELTKLDISIHKKYILLMKLYDENDKQELKDEQLYWQTNIRKLREPDQFKKLMNERDDSLDEKLKSPKAYEGLYRQLDLLEANPQDLKVLLEEFDNNLSKAWLALMYVAGYIKEPDNEEQAIQLFREIETTIPEVSPDDLTRAFKSSNKEALVQAFITLRLAYDQLPDEIPRLYPCFIEDKYYDEASSLVVYWQSSRDNLHPQTSCPKVDYLEHLTYYTAFKRIIKELDDVQNGSNIEIIEPNKASTLAIRKRHREKMERLPLAGIDKADLKNGDMVLSLYKSNPKIPAEKKAELADIYNHLVNELAVYLRDNYELDMDKSKPAAEAIVTCLAYYFSEKNR